MQNNAMVEQTFTIKRELYAGDDHILYNQIMEKLVKT